MHGRSQEHSLKKVGVSVASLIQQIFIWKSGDRGSTKIIHETFIKLQHDCLKELKKRGKHA